VTAAEFWDLDCVRKSGKFWSLWTKGQQSRTLRRKSSIPHTWSGGSVTISN